MGRGAQWHQAGRASLDRLVSRRSGAVCSVEQEGHVLPLRVGRWPFRPPVLTLPSDLHSAGTKAPAEQLGDGWPSRKQRKLFGL